MSNDATTISRDLWALVTSNGICPPCGTTIKFPNLACGRNNAGRWICKQHPYMGVDLAKNQWTIVDMELFDVMERKRQRESTPTRGSSTSIKSSDSYRNESNSLETTMKTLALVTDSKTQTDIIAMKDEEIGVSPDYNDEGVQAVVFSKSIQSQTEEELLINTQAPEVEEEENEEEDEDDDQDPSEEDLKKYKDLSKETLMCIAAEEENKIKKLMQDVKEYREMKSKGFITPSNSQSVKQLTRKVDNLQKELNGANLLISDLNSQVSDLRGELENEHIDNDTLNKANRKYQTQLNDISSLFDKEMKKKESLEREVMSLEDEDAIEYINPSLWKPKNKSASNDWHKPKAVVRSSNKIPFSLDSVHVETLLKSWSISCPSDYDGFKSWLSSIVNGADITTLPKNQELTNLPEDILNGFLVIIIPLLQQRSDVHVDVMVKERQETDLRISIDDQVRVLDTFNTPSPDTYEMEEDPCLPSPDGINKKDKKKEVATRGKSRRGRAKRRVVVVDLDK